MNKNVISNGIIRFSNDAIVLFDFTINTSNIILELLKIYKKKEGNK